MIKLTDITQCFYVPGAHSIIDAAFQNEAGEWVSLYGNKTLMQIRDEKPDAVMGNLDEWTARHEQSLIGTPEEITEEQFEEALECLPPESWQNHSGGESFVMSEYFSGRITSIYVCLGERYFTWHDVANLPHADRLAKARTLLCASSL